MKKLIADIRQSVSALAPYIALVVAAAVVVWLVVGCSSTPFQRDVVTPDGTIQVQEVVEHTIPGTSIPLWEDVSVPASPEIPPSQVATGLGEFVKAVVPYAETWWPLLLLAFKRPRSNLVASGKKAVKGDLAGAVKSLVAVTGLTHTPTT